MAVREAAPLAREAVDAFNAGDWDRLREVLADDCVFEELATGRRMQGPDETIEVLAGWKQGFPDARGTITNVVPGGEHVALEITWEGTHTGPLETPLGTIPPSGRRAMLPAVQVTQVRDGKIQGSRHFFDLMALLHQIGIREEVTTE